MWSTSDERVPCARSLSNPVINMKRLQTIDFTVSFAADVFCNRLILLLYLETRKTKTYLDIKSSKLISGHGGVYRRECEAKASDPRIALLRMNLNYLPILSRRLFSLRGPENVTFRTKNKWARKNSPDHRYWTRWLSTTFQNLRFRVPCRRAHSRRKKRPPDHKYKSFLHRIFYVKLFR